MSDATFERVYKLIMHFERIIPRDYESVYQTTRRSVIYGETILEEEFQQMSIFCLNSQDFTFLIELINQQLHFSRCTITKEQVKALKDLREVYTKVRDGLRYKESQEKKSIRKAMEVFLDKSDD